MKKWQLPVMSVLACLALCGVARAAVTLSQDRQAFVRGEIAQVKLDGPAGNVQLDLILNGGIQMLAFGPFPVPGTAQLDTAGLRPGSYSVSLHGQPDGKPGELVVRGVPLPHVSFGVWDNDPPSVLAAGPRYDTLGVEHCQTHHPQAIDAAFTRVLDQLFKYGIHFQPGIWIHLSGADQQNKFSEKMAMLTANGKHWHDGWGVESLCPYRPAAQQAIRDRLQQLGDAIKPYPYVDGISLEDEWSMANCSCPDCLARLKEKTGLSEIPKALFQPSGTVIPDSDPYLRYLRAVKWPAAGFMYKTANDAIKQVTRKPTIFSIPGAGEGLDAAENEVYTGLYDDPEFFVYGVGPELGDEVPSALRMQVSPEQRAATPCWYLVGWYSAPLRHASDWTFTLGAEAGKMSLANGAADVTVTGMKALINTDERFRRMMEDVAAPSAATGRCSCTPGVRRARWPCCAAGSPRNTMGYWIPPNWPRRRRKRNGKSRKPPINTHRRSRWRGRP